jgi:hypothetical protein
MKYQSICYFKIGANGAGIKGATIPAQNRVLAEISAQLARA